MKKLLVVMLVLSLASLANAQLLISVNGNHAVTEATVMTGTVLTIDVWGDGTTTPDLYLLGIDSGSTGTGALSIDSAVMLYTGNKTYITTGNAAGDSPFDWTAGDGDAVEMMINDVPAVGQQPKPLTGVLVDQILFTCTGLGDVILALGDPFFEKIVGTEVTIHQITPEPVTVALLGLGGLFLRRRSK